MPLKSTSKYVVIRSNFTLTVIDTFIGVELILRALEMLSTHVLLCYAKKCQKKTMGVTLPPPPFALWSGPSPQGGTARSD